ncbi:hypothetical protein HF086_015989 [Spodoptera exigua]|uniref:Uncharacterized protein n=1 Tax=Spodoptera exigua TaxID=7107 RepID=A0A922MNW6_SPOEX|nr:hypothetical protein HF086_015989 [Spodoptera exigua]
MCETKLKLGVVLIVLCVALSGLQAVDDCKLNNLIIPNLLKRHKIDWNKNPLDMDDFDDDDTEEIFDDKDKDVKVPNKYNLQAGPV